MNSPSSLLLIGVGGAGSSIAYSVNRAFGSTMNHVLCDTDASSSRASSPFILLGGDRLSGHSSGGDIQKAKLATEESLHLFAEHIKHSAVFAYFRILLLERYFYGGIGIFLALGDLLV